LLKNLLARPQGLKHIRKERLYRRAESAAPPKSSFSANRKAAILCSLFLSSLFRRGLEPHPFKNTLIGSQNVKGHSGAAVFDLNVRVSQRVEDLPHDRNSTERVHAACQARDENEG
jgi:hypothetical protein